MPSSIGLVEREWELFKPEFEVNSPMLYIYVYIYIYMCVCVYACMCVYAYIYNIVFNIHK